MLVTKVAKVAGPRGRAHRELDWSPLMAWCEGLRAGPFCSYPVQMAPLQGINGQPFQRSVKACIKRASRGLVICSKGQRQRVSSFAIFSPLSSRGATEVDDLQRKPAIISGHGSALHDHAGPMERSNFGYRSGRPFLERRSQGLQIRLMVVGKLGLGSFLSAFASVV